VKKERIREKISYALGIINYYFAIFIFKMLRLLGSCMEGIKFNDDIRKKLSNDYHLGAKSCPLSLPRDLNTILRSFFTALGGWE